MSMNTRASSFDSRISLVVLFLLADSAVQIVFKLAGDKIGSGNLDFAWLVTAVGTPMVWFAIALYFSIFVLWMLILQDMDISRAFPLTALTYVTVPAAGLIFFNEPLDFQRALGIAIILTGVVLVGKE